MRALRLTLMGMTLLAAAPAARAADYLGAEAALKQAQKQAAPENNPVGQLRAELDQLKQKSAQLPPAEAAKSWLALADRHLALDVNALAQRGQFIEQPQFQEVVAALPPPAAWDALSAAIQAREPAPERRDLLDESWLLFSHLLKGEANAQWADVVRMRALLSKAQPQQKATLVYQIPTLVQQVAAASNDPERIVQAFELQLSLRGGGQEMGYLPVPDLVRLIGAQKAEPILRRVLTTSSSLLYFQEQNATRKLAAKLALGLVPQLRAPQWFLAASLDGAPLYEALQKRFPAIPAAPRRGRFNGGMNPQDQQFAQARMSARTYYLLSRVVSGKMAEALAMAPALRTQNEGGFPGGYQDPTAFNDVVHSGHRNELLQFLRAVLEKWPDLPLWQSYSQYALEAGQGEAVAQLCRQMLQRKGTTPATAMQIRERLVDALLALNRPDDAVTELRVMMRAPANPEVGDDPATHAIRLAKLGRALKKPEWVNEGLRVALAHADDGENVMIDGHLSELVPILLDLGRGPEAEKLLIASLARQAQNQQMQMGMGMGGDGQALLLLAELYHRAGRHADVLTLLRKAPSWGAEDLSEIVVLASEEDLPLGYMAAAALADAGQKSEATRILHSLLLRRPEFDPGFELLAKLEGPAALPFLEQLFQRDPFEERPLIWKAYVLLHANRLEEAEKAARAAITIDPSDGEQQHGRRMRVYAVLADILHARGDTAQANLYRGVIRAIRMSEEADRLVEAGLLQRGIQLYNESLGQFADAYCIQSRLAVRLAEQGRLQEAEAHFKRAFELMPSSFGRVETHCLGCEGVFTSKQAQAIAEKVFTELMAREPERAQVHYLMGYLREQQGRYAEAHKHFQEAVRRDPDYLNAWKHLNDLGDKIRIAPAEQNQITASLVRLDPLSRHERGETGFGGDLRALWTAVEGATRSHPAVADEKLMPLTESARMMETTLAQHPEFAMQRAQMRQQRMMMFRGMSRFSWMESGGDPGRAAPTPGEAVAAHPSVQAVTGVLDALRGSRAQTVQ